MSEIFRVHIQTFSHANWWIDEILIPNLAIFCSYSTEMHLLVINYGIKALENFCKSFLKIPYLLIMELILE